MEGETILCIATRAWHSLWRSTQQYMSRMASQNRVLFFEPGRNPDRPVFSEFVRNLPRFFTASSQEVQSNLILISSPSIVPYGRRHLPGSLLHYALPVVRKINAEILIRHVRHTVERFEVESPILWLYSPGHFDLANRFGEKLVCYFVYDEYAEFVSNRRIKELLQQYDERMTRRADVVFASSRAQWERRKPLNPETYFIPNGVDFELFSRTLDEATPLPQDIAGVKKPVIGYLGWLGYQIDVDLLSRVADCYPHCSLVLVGPDEIPNSAGLRRLRDAPNVHFLGNKDRSSLPGYLKSFDAALIPYRLIGYTMKAYPLKMHEYLAAGRAVVATALPELQQYSHLIRIAQTSEEFIRHIDVALNDHSAEAIEARMTAARQNTWNERLEAIYRVLETQIGGLHRNR